MKKTLTAALALSTFAGLALATSTIDTAPAGCVEKGTSDNLIVCNPFISFSGNPTTLGDIDGSNIGNGGYIRIVSSNGRASSLYWQNNGAAGAGWYDEATGGNCSNSVQLVRGDAIQFVGAGNEYPLVLSGLLANVDPDAKPAAVGGYTLVGNASPGQKTLGDFVLTGASTSDYVNLNGVKYVYKNGHWFTRDGGTSADDVIVPAGQGLFLFCQTRKRGTTPTITISVPGEY